MYKNYKHKLNMMAPGGNIVKAIILLLLIGTIHHLLEQEWLQAGQTAN